MTLYKPTEADGEEPVEHKPVKLLEIEPEKLTEEEAERIKTLEGLIAEEEGRTEEVQDEQSTEEGGITGDFVNLSLSGVGRWAQESGFEDSDNRWTRYRRKCDRTKETDGQKQRLAKGLFLH